MKRQRKWFNIPGYKGYQITEKGVVKSLKRKVWNRFCFVTRKARILSPNPDGSGYPTVHVVVNGKKTTASIHKLLGITFKNHIVNGFEKVIDHKDEDILNFELNNLQSISHRENVNRSKRIGTSQYVGVQYNKKRKKYVSYIREGKKRRFLGYFKKELDAAYAYQDALDEIERRAE